VDSNNAAQILPQSASEIEELFAEIEGARMRYLRAGSGPPLILLHGLMGYSFSWRFTIPALSRYATVYAVDSIGTGFSDRPAGLDCSLRSGAQRLLRFAEAVGIKSFDLLGTSYGGAVAMMAASMCAQRPGLHLRRLILVAPVNPWSPHGRRLAPFLGSKVGSKLFLRSVDHMRWTFPYWLARLFGDPKRIPAGTLEGYLAPVSIPGSFEYAIGIVRRWKDCLEQIDAVLPQIADVPTLLVWGSADAAVYSQSAEKLRQYFRHCDVTVFPGVGHLPYEEVPDRFNATLIEFLTRNRSEH
jgi:pimeloyl-ACP methyl ester carboxylesterase